LEGLAALAFQPKVATDTLRMLMNFWLGVNRKTIFSLSKNINMVLKEVIGVGHKMGHYTGTEYMLLPIGCNY